MKNLKALAYQLRKDTIDIILAGGGGHIGGDMSVMEVLVDLYFKQMNVSPDRLDDPDRDYFILSKGHSMEAYYAVLCERGFLDLKEVKEKFSKFNSPYIGHPHNTLPGIEMNSGSLGHGLPVAVGLALAAKKKGKANRVYVLYELLWHWAKRRHPKKGKWWISTKYWHRKGNRSWVFSTEEYELIRVDHTPIVRHRKVCTTKNPYIDTEYFVQRKFNQGMARLSGRFKLIWKNQDGRCYHCGLPLSIRDDREIFYKVPKSKGGEDIVSNMAYVHSDCQRLYVESRSKER